MPKKTGKPWVLRHSSNAGKPFPELSDMIDAEHFEIQISKDAKTVWVNVNGVCVLRCAQIKNLIITDDRKGGEPTLITS